MSERKINLGKNTLKIMKLKKEKFTLNLNLTLKCTKV